MNKRHPIDEFFSQRLANSSASVPDDMWSRIAKNRKKQSRKKFLAWTTLSSLALGLCVFAWWALDDVPLLGYFPVNVETSASIGIAANTNSSEQSSIGISSNTIVDVASSDAQPIMSASGSTAPLAVRPTEINSTVNRSTVANISALHLQENIENTSTITPSSAGIDQVNSNTPITSIAASTAIEENKNSSVSGPHQRVGLGKVDRLPSKLYKLSGQTDLKLFANHAPRCADFNSPFFHLDAELLAGPAYASQMLVAKTNESVSHLQQRNDSEIAKISTSTSLRLAATSNTGLGLRSGFSYSQINEQFTHQVGSKIDVSIIFGPNGEVLGRDTVYTEAYAEKSTNRLKFIEIPLLLSYERKVGKLRIGINAGAYLNLYFDAKGTVFSPATNEPIAFGQEGDLNSLPIFERRATAAWYGGLSLAYNLHSRYSLLAEPFFKTYPRALSSTGYDLSQNYWMTGLQIGLRMRL